MNYDSKILTPLSINADFKHKIEEFNDLLTLDCFSIVNESEDLRCLENPLLKKWMRFDNFVIFGTGGSSLGGQCICSIAEKPAKNIKFASNLDPQELSKLFSEIDVQNTGFLCISKSGETLETICQTILAIEQVIKCSQEIDIKDRFVFITENKKSSMTDIAAQFDFLCLEHPKTIGGRFSVFSIVGMLPALLAGFAPAAIRSGGRNTLKNFDKIIKDVWFIVHSFQQKITQHVSFIYSDRLTAFGAWLAQLYAESTGKSGVGITPLTAMGSVDQHSQLQLYLDGPRDKCFTFLIEKQSNNLFISEDIYIPPSFSYLRKKKIADVFTAQAQATIASMLETKHSVRKFEFQKLTPETLGSLLMHFMLEVVCVSRLIKVNPFDQPAVEYGKVITKNLLSTRDDS